MSDNIVPTVLGSHIAGLFRNEAGLSGEDVETSIQNCVWSVQLFLKRPLWSVVLLQILMYLIVRDDWDTKRFAKLFLLLKDLDQAARPLDFKRVIKAFEMSDLPTLQEIYADYAKQFRPAEPLVPLRGHFSPESAPGHIL